MSSLYNMFYDQSHIPCTKPQNNAAAEDGTGTVNIDGVLMTGGVMCGGKCVRGNKSDGNLPIFYAGGGNFPYTATGSATATNAHTIRAARANHL